jgi:hypothetical protein
VRNYGETQGVYMPMDLTSKTQKNQQRVANAPTSKIPTAVERSRPTAYHHCVIGDTAMNPLPLGEFCYDCFRHDSVDLTSNTGGAVLPGSAPLDYLPGDQARDSEHEFAYPPD